VKVLSDDADAGHFSGLAVIQQLRLQNTAVFFTVNYLHGFLQDYLTAILSSSGKSIGDWINTLKRKKDKTGWTKWRCRNVV
jgi:hypothetical protein